MKQSEPIAFPLRLLTDNPTPDTTEVEFLTVDTPYGKVPFAFESPEVLHAIVMVNGTADGIFFRPETDLPAVLAKQLDGGKLVILRSYRDYKRLFDKDPSFPWDDCIVTYDASSVITRDVRDVYDSPGDSP